MIFVASPPPSLNAAQTVILSQESDPRQSEISEYLDTWREYSLTSLRSLRSGQVRALDIDFAPVGNQLDLLVNLHDGWDGYSAPRPLESTIKEARNVLVKLQEELLRPNRVGASAEGGIAISFYAPGDRRAQLELLNNGEKFIHLYDLNGNSSTHEWPANYSAEQFGSLVDPLVDYLWK